MKSEIIEAIVFAIGGIALVIFVALNAEAIGARKACKSINAEWVDDTCMKVTREKI